MARVPPSSADFTPAWLKFNDKHKKSEQASAVSSSASLLLQCGNLPNRNPVGKQNLSNNRSPLRRSPTNLTDFESPDFSKTCLARHYSVDNDKPWPGLEGLIGKKDEWPSSSTISNKWSFSTVRNGKGVQHVANNSSSNRSSALDAEFPSLENNGPKPSQRTLITNQPNNMWSKPLNIKSNHNDATGGFEVKGANQKPPQNTNSIYRSFVPKSNAGFVKQPYRRTISVPAGSHNDTKQGSSTNIQPRKMNSPTSLHLMRGHESLSTPPLTGPTSEETQVMPAVKRHRRGKNLFLKELRQENDDSIKARFIAQPIITQFEVADIDQNNTSSDSSLYDPYESTDLSKTRFSTQPELEDQEMQLGKCDDQHKLTDEDKDATDWWNDDKNMADEPEHVSIKDGKSNDPVLSSSLEAEHRLLREMGWTQSDEGAEGDGAGSDESPLTEAEIREFFLSNKRKGLLGVPSSSHREMAFRNALSAWSSSGPIFRRSLQQENIGEKSAKVGAASDSSTSDSSQLSLSDLDSD